MIFPRLYHLAVILLVLLSVVSAMVGSIAPVYKNFASTGICLSLKHLRNLTDCCDTEDIMQQLYVLKTGRSKGIYHSGNMRKILCYNEKKGRFEGYKRGTRATILKHCQKHIRHKRHRGKRHRGRGHRPRLCFITPKELKVLRRKKHLTCELNEWAPGGGYFYMSVEEGAKYLGIKNGRVKRLRRRGKVEEPEEPHRRLFSLTQRNMQKIFPTKQECHANRIP